MQLTITERRAPSQPSAAPHPERHAIRLGRRSAGTALTRRLRLALLACGTLVCADSQAAARNAETPARWELGVGIAGLQLPLYRGTRADKTYLVPFPHLIYHSPRLRIDEGAVHGRLFRSRRVKLDLSLAGGLPAPGDGGSPRSGMPDLDPTGELGPQLNVLLGHDRAARSTWWFRLPVRTAFSVGHGDIVNRGWIAAPFLEYRRQGGTEIPWSFGVSAGPQFADSEYHNYYYRVAPEFVTPERPAYDAAGGYSGSRITLTLRRDYPNWWIGAFVRLDTLEHAVFADSPLVETLHYRSAGFAIAWILARSGGSVEHGNED